MGKVHKYNNKLYLPNNSYYLKLKYCLIYIFISFSPNYFKINYAPLNFLMLMNLKLIFALLVKFGTLTIHLVACDVDALDRGKIEDAMSQWWK